MGRRVPHSATASSGLYTIACPAGPSHWRALLAGPCRTLARSVHTDLADQIRDYVQGPPKLKEPSSALCEPQTARNKGSVLSVLSR